MSRARYLLLVLAGLLLLAAFAWFQRPNTASADILSVSPETITVLVGGEASAEVRMTSPEDGSCLVAMRAQGGLPTGMEVTFQPRCGQGSWTAGMRVKIDPSATGLVGPHVIGVVELPGGQPPATGVFQTTVVVVAPRTGGETAGQATPPTQEQSPALPRGTTDEPTMQEPSALPTREQPAAIPKYTVVVRSSIGRPFGQGIYEQGSAVIIGVRDADVRMSSILGSLGGSHRFRGWKVVDASGVQTGEIENAEARVTVNQDLVFIARWEDDLTIPAMLVALVGIVILLLGPVSPYLPRVDWTHMDLTKKPVIDFVLT